jgi:hypothetical protein
MFHPGKIVQVLRVNDKSVFGSDRSVQAVVSMWDENLLTVEVEAALAERVTEGDVVLLDYTPRFSTSPVPKQSVVKVLRGSAGKQLWSVYQERIKKRKPEIIEDESDRMPVGGLHVR